MTRTELNNLVEALEAAVSAAQSDISRQQESALRYRIEQQDGRTSAINYALYVRSGRQLNGHAEMIEIPLCSLRANRMFQVNKVSLQFTTMYPATDNRQVSTKAQPDTGMRPRLRRVLNWLCRWPKYGWPRRARIDLQCTGTDPLTSELRIDGKRSNPQQLLEVRADSSRTP
jgi:hypothetical protein